MTPARLATTLCSITACALLGAGLQQPAAAAEAGAETLRDPREVHLADVRQLTFGGENAEAYWAPSGDQLIMQANFGDHPCDQIYLLPVDGSGERTLVSTGKGRTTCSFFTYPQGERILYSSTHLGGEACPPNPDMSQGYVWALYDTYDLFSAAPDGSDVVRLTDTPGYDAEATVCQRDGTIVFTSVRDGDLDLYRMDPDGSNVVRLTDTPGYDGGAFFSADCSKIVWRASRPQGEALEEYQRLLAQGLVRPSKLEVWVADADGTDARQVTYLDSASFAPFFYPSGERIIFSSNYGGSPREFDLWAIDVDGSDLERITYTPEFDGFPMFSPDGEQLVFASNRNASVRGETNIFLARWVDDPAAGEEMAERAPDRYARDVAWLAADEREGRGLGTAGLDAAADWLVERFAALGLEPAGSDGYRQPFEAPYAVEVGGGTALSLDGTAVAAESFRPASFSASGEVAGEVVPAGYGITSEEHGIDDYDGVDVEGKIALVRRFTPEGGPFDDEDVERRLSDLRYKAFNAREHGAVGLLVVDLPPPGDEEPPEEAAMPPLKVDTGKDAGLPVALVSREIGAPLFDGGHRAELEVELLQQKATAYNIVGKVAAGAAERLPGSVVVGAHYDHLGFGGPGSLAPDEHVPHNGADDNASGTAALLEAARQLAEHRDELQRDVYVIAFSGEESGVLGSTHLTRTPPPGLDLDAAVAMVNMDMVGRLRDNQLSVLGAESAEEWGELVPPACDREGLGCELGGDGYGPSDQTPFYAAGLPVLHLFTGVHDDYHRPSDDADKINAAGGAQVAALAADLTEMLANRAEPLTYKSAPAPPKGGDVRSFGASLGTIPDYVGPGEGVEGVLLSGVRPDSPAEKAGMQRGDLLVELAGTKIGDIYDFVYVLRQAKPGQKATAVVERDGHRVELVVTFGVSRGMR